MEMNFYAIATAAFSTLVVGMFWYSEMAFGKIWMREIGIKSEDTKKTNFIKIFLLTFIFSFFLSAMTQVLVIHQFGAFGMIGGDASKALPSYTTFMNDYGSAYRTFQHGALHGSIAGLFIVTPIIAINGLFESKSLKYILIHSGYWIITLTVMGAIICGWV